MTVAVGGVGNETSSFSVLISSCSTISGDFVTSGSTLNSISPLIFSATIGFGDVIGDSRGVLFSIIGDEMLGDSSLNSKDGDAVTFCCSSRCLLLASISASSCSMETLDLKKDLKTELGSGIAAVAAVVVGVVDSKRT